MKIAIVGATGLVGRNILKILDERKLIENNKIVLFSSKKSAGTVITQNKHLYIVRELKNENIDSDFDYALFSAGEKVSLLFAPLFQQTGCVVIDNSSAYRKDENVPLVVPEINPHHLINHNNIISNPNCSTIILSVPLFALHKEFKIKRLVVTTFQAVSGAGKKGIDDLENNTNEKLDYPIHNNLIPQIGKFNEKGYTTEEEKMQFELSKIFNDKTIKITTTCVRVPIKNCHSESINIEFEKDLNIEKIKYILSSTKGVTFFETFLPMPIFADEKDDIYVGRLRQDPTQKNTINLFICGDNIRKGASLNAVQILEELMKLTKKTSD